jgi:hypothetical protein
MTDNTDNPPFEAGMQATARLAGQLLSLMVSQASCDDGVLNWQDCIFAANVAIKGLAELAAKHTAMTPAEIDVRRVLLMEMAMKTQTVLMPMTAPGESFAITPARAVERH